MFTSPALSFFTHTHKHTLFISHIHTYSLSLSLSLSLSHWVCVCVNVCVYVCVSVCVFVCVYVCVSACVHRSNPLHVFISIIIFSWIECYGLSGITRARVQANWNRETKNKLRYSWKNKILLRKKPKKFSFMYFFSSRYYYFIPAILPYPHPRSIFQISTSTVLSSVPVGIIKLIPSIDSLLVQRLEFIKENIMKKRKKIRFQPKCKIQEKKENTNLTKKTPKNERNTILAKKKKRE